MTRKHELIGASGRRGTAPRPMASRPGEWAARAVGLLVCLAAIGTPRVVMAQQTVAEALSFLLSGRSLPVDTFVPTVPADRSPADALAGALRGDLAVRPMTSPSGGLSYEWNAAIATMARPTDSFGPVFTTRARAIGERRASISLAVRQVELDAVDGRTLTDGSVVAAASTAAGEASPFDIQSVTLRIRARTATFTGQLGVTDRMDFVATVPFVDLTLSGERVDTYRGTPIPQATAFASASGLGDVVMHAKYQLVQDGARALAVLGEFRLPTGNTANSLGTGERLLAPVAVGSIELRRLSVHAELGYVFGETTDAVRYAGAITVAPMARVTLTGEVLGRTDFDAPRLTTLTVPHPTLAGVSTALLAGTTATSHRVAAVFGVKWNVAGAWLVNAHVVHPLTDAGFTTQWSPAVTFDYVFQQ